MASTSATSKDVKLSQEQKADLLPVISNNASENDRNNTGVLRKTYPPSELQSRMDEKDMCTDSKIQYAKDFPLEIRRLIYKEYNEGVSEESLARKYNTTRRIVCYIVKKYKDSYMDPPEYPLELRARKEKKQSSNCTVPKTHSAKELSTEIKLQIYREYNNGVSPEDLARKYNTCHQIVYYIGNHCTVLVSPETKNLICNDYKEGATVEALARKYEFNCSTINYLLFKRGAIRKRLRKQKPRKVYTKKKIRHAVICREYNAGICIDTLAQKYNLSSCNISWILKTSAKKTYNMVKDCNKRIPYTYIDMAPMTDDVSKVEIEIKKELEDLDEEDEFEKLIEQSNILIKPDIKNSLESNELVSGEVIMKTEHESDSLCDSMNGNVCLELKKERLFVNGNIIKMEPLDS